MRRHTPLQYDIPASRSSLVVSGLHHLAWFPLHKLYRIQTEVGVVTHFRSSGDQSSPPKAPCDGDGKKLISASKMRRMPHAGCRRQGTYAWAEQVVEVRCTRVGSEPTFNILNGGLHN